MKQGFSQKMLNIEKNLAQQENILNQLFPEVRNLKNNKTNRKNNSNNQVNIQDNEGVDNSSVQMRIGNVGQQKDKKHAMGRKGQQNNVYS